MTESAADMELREAFSLFDIDHDGLITMSELKKLIEKVGGSITEGEARGLIHQADRDGNEGIDFSEFSKLWAAIRGDGKAETEFRKEFQKLDKDNSGFITKDEMMSVIEESGHFAEDKAAEAKKCVDELDVNGDGQVSYPEFLLVWKYRK